MFARSYTDFHRHTKPTVSLKNVAGHIRGSWTMHSRSGLLKIAVFFIPGLLFLIPIRPVFPPVERELKLLWDDPKITRLVVVLIVCFIAGALIDFLRATLTSFIQWIQSFGKRSASFLEKLRISDSLTSRTHNYRYLAFNSSLSILVGWGLSHLKPSDSTFWTLFSFPWVPPVFAVVLALCTLGISYWNARRAVSRLEEAAQHNGKCKGDS